MMISGYFNRLEDELAQLTEGGAHLPEPSRRRRFAWGAFIPAVASTVAIAVAVVFLTSVQRRPAPRTPAVHHRGFAGGGFTYPLGAVPTLDQLFANFGVLRRGQTSADRSWTPQCGCAGSARQLDGLTRRALTLTDGYRVFLDVEEFLVAGNLNMAAGTYILNLDIVDRHGNSSSTSFGPNVGYTVSPLSSGGPREQRLHPGRPRVFASLVPDGVSTVSWSFACPHGLRASQACMGTRAQTVSVPVVDNVAARELSGVCAPCQPRVVWHAADGRVVATFPDGYGNLPAAPFVAGGRGTRVLRALSPQGVGTARIGEPSSVAVARITRLLGPPARANVPAGGCGVDHESVWTSPTAADPLTIFQHAGRLVGYVYGAPVSEIGLQRGPGAILETAHGLTLGDEIGTARRLYRGNLVTRAARGIGHWQATDRHGTVSGVVLPITYPLRTVTSQHRIATIGAGERGCS